MDLVRSSGLLDPLSNTLDFDGACWSLGKLISGDFPPREFTPKRMVLDTRDRWWFIAVISFTCRLCKNKVLKVYLTGKG